MSTDSRQTSAEISPASSHLSRLEVVVRADRNRGTRDDQLEPGAATGLPDLCLTALVVLRPPEAAGDVDDPMAARLELEHGRGAARHLVVRMGCEMEQGPADKRVAAPLLGPLAIIRSAAAYCW